MSEVKKLSEVSATTTPSGLMAILTDSNGNLSKTAIGNLSQVSYKENDTGSHIAYEPGLNLVFVYSTDDRNKYWIGFYWKGSQSEFRCVEIASSGITILSNGFGTITVNNGVTGCVYRAYSFKPAII